MQHTFCMYQLHLHTIAVRYICSKNLSRLRTIEGHHVLIFNIEFFTFLICLKKTQRFFLIQIQWFLELTDMIFPYSYSLSILLILQLWFLFVKVAKISIINVKARNCIHEVVVWIIKQKKHCRKKIIISKAMIVFFALLFYFAPEETISFSI